MRNLLVLGGGTAGTVLANTLFRRLGLDWQITVVDQDDAHVYQPGLLIVPFGSHALNGLARPRGQPLLPLVELVLGQVRAAPQLITRSRRAGSA